MNNLRVCVLLFAAVYPWLLGVGELWRLLKIRVRHAKRNFRAWQMLRDARRAAHQAPATGTTDRSETTMTNRDDRCVHGKTSCDPCGHNVHDPEWNRLTSEDYQPSGGDQNRDGDHRDEKNGN